MNAKRIAKESMEGAQSDLRSQSVFSRILFAKCENMDHNINMSKLRIEGAELRRLVAQGLSCKQIASYYGCKKSTIYNKLKEYNVELPYQIKHANLIGKKYGYLTPLRYVGRKSGKAYFECKCDCGNTKEIQGNHVARGRIKSCGCKIGELLKQNRKPSEKQRQAVIKENKARALPPVEITCKNCGEKKKKVQKFRHHVFCDDKCYNEYRRVNAKEHDSIYKTWQYREWRERVFKRDGYKCRRCGSDYRICPHHVYGKTAYPEKIYEINNGVTLCRECHFNAHGLAEGQTKRFGFVPVDVAHLPIQIRRGKTYNNVMG